MEHVMQIFNPDFKGKGNPQTTWQWAKAHANIGSLMELGTGVPKEVLEAPPIQLGDLISKKHPIAKAVAEFGSGFFSPENIAVMLGTEGLGTLAKVPKAAGPAKVVSKLMSAGWSLQALQGAWERYEPFRKAMEAGDSDEALYQFTHGLLSGTLAVAAGSHAAEGTPLPGKGNVYEGMPLMTPAESQIAKALYGASKMAVEKPLDMAATMRRSLGDRIDSALNKAPTVPEAVMRMSNMVGKKDAPEFRKSIEDIEPDVTAIINSAPNAKTPAEVGDLVEKHIQQEVNAPLQREAGATRNSPEPVVPNFVDRLQNELDRFFTENKGSFSRADEQAIRQRINSQLIPNWHEVIADHANPQVPNLFETENARQTLGKIDPANAQGYNDAASHIANFLREVVDQAYDARGIKNVKESRLRESKLIPLRDALYDAQAKYELQQDNNHPINKFIKYGTRGLLLGSWFLHVLSGGAGLGLLGLEEAARSIVNKRNANLRDIGTNVQRAQELAGQTPNAQAVTPDITNVLPPVIGPRPAAETPESPVTPPGRPAPPTAPVAPTAPEPAQRSAVDHGVWAALASFFGGQNKRDTIYADLRKQFDQHMANIRQDQADQKLGIDGYKPRFTPEERQAAWKMQDMINKADAIDDNRTDKENAQAQKKFQQAQAKYNAEMKKHQAAVDQWHRENQNAAGEQDKVRRDAMINDERVAHGKVAKATMPAMEIPSVGTEHTAEQRAGHEYGHIITYNAAGLDPVAFLTHEHPDVAAEKGAAQIQASLKAMKKGGEGVAQRVLGLLGGAAWDEVHSDIKLDRNLGASSDISKARRLLRESGLSGTNLELVFDAIYDEAKQHVSNPDAIALAKANMHLREEGLGSQYHMSPGRLENFNKLLKGVLNAETTGTEGASERGSDGRDGEGRGESEGAGENEAGPAKEVRAEGVRKGSEGKSKAQREFEELNEGSNVTTSAKSHKATGEVEKAEIAKPKERSTGSSELDEAIKAGGGIPGGIMKGFEYPDKATGETRRYPDTALVHEPVTGTSLNFPTDQLTPEFVRQRLMEKRAEFGVPEPEEKANLAHEPGFKTLAQKAVEEQNEKRANLGRDIASRLEEDFDRMERNKPTVDRANLQGEPHEDDGKLDMNELQNPTKMDFKVMIQKPDGMMETQTIKAHSFRAALRQAEKSNLGSRAVNVERVPEGPKTVPDYKVPKGKLASMPVIMSGKSPQATIFHELGHAMKGLQGGMELTGMKRHTAPGMKGARAAIEWNITPMQLNGGGIKPEYIPTLLEAAAGGIAADEIHNGIERQNNMNFTRQDRPGSDGYLMRRLIREAGITDPTEVEAAMNNYVDRAKEYLTNEHVSAVMKENAPFREKDLSSQWHYSPERLNAMHAEIQRRVGPSDLWLQRGQNAESNNRASVGNGTENRVGNVAGGEGATPTGAPVAQAAESTAPEVKEQIDKANLAQTPQEHTENDENRGLADVVRGRAPEQFPHAGENVSGLNVRKDVPNMRSIGSTFQNYHVHDGVREIPIEELGKPQKYANAADNRRVEALAEQIKQSGEINPLIVVKDSEGYYVLEGGHRLGALQKLGKESVPAVVVSDLEKGGIVEPSIDKANLQKAGEPEKRPANLLGVSADAKTIKGEKKGVLTGIMYLAPADTSDVINVCANASEGCKASCLNTAGRAGIFPAILEARKAKTKWMVNDPTSFKAQLVKDISALDRKAQRENMTPAVRINGTSDLPKLAWEMAEKFPHMQFYDYTKHPRPWEHTRPNYHLTFSLSENNEPQAREALAHGINVAVPFFVKKGAPLPKEYLGVPVIDGDETDLRFLDKEKGVVVGLRAKGRAKKDTTGFVKANPDLVQISPTTLKPVSHAEKAQVTDQDVDRANLAQVPTEGEAPNR
jgi:hypothetical protein